jgi:hypothetical protein
MGPSIKWSIIQPQKGMEWLCAVTHACSPSYSGGRDWEFCRSRPAQPHPPPKKIGEASPSQSISQVWWHGPVTPGMQEAIGRRIKSEAGPSK